MNFIACQPKTANTYIRQVLRNYWKRLGFDRVSYGIAGAGHKVANIDFIAQGKKIGVNTYYGHVLPNSELFDIVKDEEIHFLVLERNIWDAMISMVDHMTHLHGGSKKNHEMDFILQWADFYLEFSMRWRDFTRGKRVMFINYDDFIGDTLGHAREIVRFLEPGRLEESKLETVVSAMDAAKSGRVSSTGSIGHSSSVKFNQGVTGRGHVFAEEPLYRALEEHLVNKSPAHLRQLFRFPGSA